MFFKKLLMLCGSICLIGCLNTLAGCTTMVGMPEPSVDMGILIECMANLAVW